MDAAGWHGCSGKSLIYRWVVDVGVSHGGKGVS